MSESVLIPDSSNYCVFSSGRVENIKTGRALKPSHTAQGAVKVSVKGDDGVLRTYSVKRLVADAFLPRVDDVEVAHLWNTPIQLDGNQDNVHVSNLAWRPRNFAHRYSHQFKNEYGYYDVGHSAFLLQRRKRSPPGAPLLVRLFVRILKWPTKRHALIN